MPRSERRKPANRRKRWPPPTPPKQGSRGRGWRSRWVCMGAGTDEAMELLLGGPLRACLACTLLCMLHVLPGPPRCPLAHRLCSSRTHARTHTRMHAHTHARTHACTHTRTHARTHARTLARMHARMHLYIHVCTHTCTNTHARTLARTHIRPHARMHTHTYGHMHRK